MFLLMEGLSRRNRMFYGTYARSLEAAIPTSLACAIGVYTGISLACQLRGENRGFSEIFKCSQAPSP